MINGFHPYKIWSTNKTLICWVLGVKTNHILHMIELLNFNNKNLNLERAWKKCLKAAYVDDFSASKSYQEHHRKQISTTKWVQYAFSCTHFSLLQWCELAATARQSGQNARLSSGNSIRTCDDWRLKKFQFAKFLFKFVIEVSLSST